MEPYIVLGADDFEEIAAIPGTILREDRVRFDPLAVGNAHVSPRIRNLMHKLVHDVWAEPDDGMEISDPMTESMAQAPTLKSSLQGRIMRRGEAGERVSLPKRGRNTIKVAPDEDRPEPVVSERIQQWLDQVGELLQRSGFKDEVPGFSDSEPARVFPRN